METVWHILWHSLLDSLKLLPFLFLTYLLMELLEHKAGERIERAITRGGRVGPFVGGVLGLLPQCGFSTAAAGLFAGRVVTVGTLLAVFLSTSDEMLAIFIGAAMPARIIFTVLGIKLAVAVLFGFLADLLFAKWGQIGQVSDLCEREGCHCEQGVWRSALRHTVKIFLFVLLVNLLLGAVLELVGAERLAAAMNGVPVLGVAASALVGLIPNCAASVAVASLYTKGLISAGAMLAGLLTGAGAGLLVLFRTNRRLRDNLAFALALFLIGALVGTLIDLTGLGAWLGL
ncbi:MAG: hypothetical protein E7663_03580 [Ruminococcaceae bacterium]|nr:hypothetical protein [Oscillospiraceae bacterium]